MTPMTPEQQQTAIRFLPIVEGWIPAHYFGHIRDAKRSDAFFALCKCLVAWKGSYDDPAFVRYLRSAICNQWRDTFRADRYQTQNRAPEFRDVYDADPASPSPELTLDDMCEQDRRILDWLAEGKSIEDIISTTGKSRSTIYRRINEAKKSWKKLFNE